MLKIRVKVGKITNLSDARYCAGMGVDWLGFPVGSPDGMDTKKYKEITHWISGPAFVLEWTEPLIPSHFDDILRDYAPQFVQVDASLVGQIPGSAPLMVNLRTDDLSARRQLLLSHKERIAFLILDSKVSRDGSVLESITREFQVLLSGITSEEMATLDQLPIAGIALEGDAEVQPGLKEYAGLSEVLEQLEVEP